jgi:hypothetical protein
MIKLIDILKEIGEATSAVPYRKTEEDKQKYQTIITYQFEIGDDIYKVDLTVSPLDDYDRPGKTSVDVYFDMKGKKDQYGSTVRTNRGVQYTVMSTVSTILKDYINQHPEVVEIHYEPVKKDAEDQGREKLYKAYVEKNLPDWNYIKDSYGHIYLRSPNYNEEPNSKSIFKRFFKNK